MDGAYSQNEMADKSFQQLTKEKKLRKMYEEMETARPVSQLLTDRVSIDSDDDYMWSYEHVSKKQGKAGFSAQEKRMKAEYQALDSFYGGDTRVPNTRTIDPSFVKTLMSE